jgi:dihydrofolate synthase / folylpolyglutamate synthase
MNYKETVEFMFSQLPAYHRVGKAAYKNDLHNTLLLDDHLGHPHRNYKTIHITGTNGKGSVSHMTASILIEAGFKTGLYTSPHLKDFRERIRVNGKMISKSAVTGFVSRNLSFINAVRPSFFEMTVGLAFDYFASEKVDIAVIEVGLGGRLDSTNIIMPEISVITNIGHDHMDLLGNTIEKIAFEKAGIIKEGVPVVIGETQQQTKNIYIAQAGKMHSEIFFADQNFRCRLDEYDYNKGLAHYEMQEMSSETSLSGESPLGGDYQSRNLQTIFQVFDVLKDRLGISDKNINDGIRNVLSNTHLQGRWQVIGKKPLMICDTGHNREGLEYITNQLRRIPKKALHMVIGFVNDKDLRLVLPLLPADAHYYFTRASVPRALDENLLMEEAVKEGLRGESYHDVRSAINAAKSNASETDLIFIGGSTFIVAEAL